MFACAYFDLNVNVLACFIVLDKQLNAILQLVFLSSFILFCSFIF